jgi:hypothetical protein
VREAGAIVGVTARLDPARRSAKHILEAVLRQIVDFKKSAPE